MISIITAEFQSPLSSLPLLEASLISDVCNIMRDQCARSRMHAHHKHSRTHTSHCVRRQEWRNTDCVVVTMALVSDFSHSECIILLKALWSTPFMANCSSLNCFRGILPPASFVHHFLTITTGRYSSVIAFVAIFSISSVARTVSFF